MSNETIHFAESAPERLSREYVAGVPLHILQQDTKRGLVTSSNGIELGYDLRYDRMSIYPVDEFGLPHDSGIRFAASVQPTNDGNARGMQFSVYSKNPDGTRHPAFPRGAMTELFDFAIQRFDNTPNAVPLRYIWTSWDPTSSHMAQYLAALQEFGPTPTEAQKLAAANKPWEGHVASKNGFYAHEVYLDGSAYKVTFAREITSSR